MIEAQVREWKAPGQPGYVTQWIVQVVLEGKFVPLAIYFHFITTKVMERLVQEPNW